MSATSTPPCNIRFTQNFLKSSRLIDRLLDRSSIRPDDVVFEIGPGKGRITACLAARCRRVIAVEKDGALAASLCRRFADEPRITIHHADCLTFPLPAVPYKVFASIPFNITTAIVTRLTGGPRPPEDLYLVIQYEAAERILGVPRESLYAVLLKPWFEPIIIHRFARTDFDPPPNVDVVMLRLRKRGPPLVGPHEAQRFRDFVVHGFTTSGPFMGSIHIGVFGKWQWGHLLTELGIDPHRGPTTVRFEQWLALFRRVMQTADSEVWQTVEGAERRLRRQQAGLSKRQRTSVAGKDYRH